jgi:hypothetical protein
MFKASRTVTVEELDRWPLYSSLSGWASILDCSRDTMRIGIRNGSLVGERQFGQRYFFTKWQILRWWAPGLYRTMYQETGVEPGHGIEVGKDMR